MIRHIVIADDHNLILDGFERIILEHVPEVTVHKVIDRDALFEVLRTEPVDMLFQDVKFGRDDARDFIRSIRDEFPALRIVIISTLGDEATVQTLLKQGVHGYISKTDDSREVIHAIEQIGNGSVYISPDISRYQSVRRVTPETVFLTAREQDILSLIMEGLTTRDIAGRLFLSEKTIELHRSNLFLKFDVKNVAALVKKAIYEGFA